MKAVAVDRSLRGWHEDRIVLQSPCATLAGEKMRRDMVDEILAAADERDWKETWDDQSAASRNPAGVDGRCDRLVLGKFQGQHQGQQKCST